MVDRESEVAPEHSFFGEARLLREGDIDQLKHILESWIKDRETQEPLPKEVSGIMDEMQKSLRGENDRTYLVAEAGSGEIVGTIGLKKPEARTRGFAKTQNPAELINAYVAVDQRRGKGVGRALVQGLEAEARRQEYTEIVLNSGPRYKDTGWGFYDRLPNYERVGVAQDLYGKGIDAPVWSKTL